MVTRRGRNWTWALMLASLGCRSPAEEPAAGSPPSSAEQSKAGAEPTAAAFALRAKLELRPLADHSEFARTLARGGLPAGVRAHLEPTNERVVDPEVVLLADDLTVLQAWSRELADELPAELRVAYEAIAPTDPAHTPTLARPLHQGWQLHFVRTDEGFAVDEGATGQLVSSAWDQQPQVQVHLADDDGERFANLTEALVGRKLAIVLEDRVVSAPVVAERIGGGTFWVSLPSTHDDAREARMVVGKLAGIPASEVVLPTPVD